MRIGLMIVALLMAAPAAGQPLPSERPHLSAMAARYMAPCAAPGTSTCQATRELLELVYPDAVFGRPRAMRRVAELLAEGPTPPIKRDLVEACAWATMAALTAREDSPDGVTVPQAEKDLLTRHCIRHGNAHQVAGMTRSAALLNELSDTMKTVISARPQGR